MTKKKKKKQVYALKRVPRLKKARQWLRIYDGNESQILCDYRNEFRVDIATALRDLQEIGYIFPSGYVDTVLYNEERRLLQKEREMQKQCRQDAGWRDDHFYFIAGYTSGGAPYGVTWEELGMEPYEDEYDSIDDEY